MKFQLLVKPSSWMTTMLVVTAALTTGLTTGAITTYSVLRYQSVAQSPLPNSSASKTPAGAVAARGYLEPKEEVIKLSAPAFIEGARVEQLLVKQGERVKAGQVIAILDSQARLQAALEQAKTQVSAAQARLTQVKAGAKKGDITAQDAKVQGIQVELAGQIATQKAAIAILEAQLQGEKSAQKATIKRIEAELHNAQTDCERYQTLYQAGAVSAQERDSNCLQAETALESLKEAQANLNRIVTTLQEKINEATANLNRTIVTLQKQMQQAQATLESVAEVRLVDVQVAQADLITAQVTVQKAQADLDLAYVRASRNGQILKIHTWPGEVVSNQGIVDLGQTNQMYVRAEVYETDIEQVRIGQPATIKGDGLKQELKGTVDEIGLQIGKKDVLGTDPVADADARVVEVKIRLTPEDSQRVAGLTNLQVNAFIKTSTSNREHF